MGAIATCRAENTRVRGGSGPDPSTVQLPIATTGTPTNVTWLGALLNGVVNGYDQAVSVSWEYGTTTAYGKTTPTQNLGASGANQNVQAQIIGLTSTTTYHCRIRATNAAGQAVGQDVTFTTQPVNGAVPSVVGTPPVVSATFESDIDYDPVSGFVTATLNGTVDAGSHAHATSYQFFLRRMDGIDVWHAINNPGTTSSTSPIAVSAYLGYILVTDADYEWYLSATNVKGTVTSVPILSFHTPDAPPPLGLPPTANTLSTANVTSTTALVTAEVNNVNTLAGTGSTNAWLRYKTGSAPLSATDYTTQVGPINLSPLTGNVVQQLPYTLTQLNSSVTYYVWAYAANPYGEADDWGSPLNFTTSAPSQLGTISVTTDPNWVAYGQATVFCTYTTPAAGTFSIRFGYRVSGSGAGYTFTSYESVAISVAAATWDRVLGGLTVSTQYDIIAELYDGSQTVQSSQGGVITTKSGPVASVVGIQPTIPGNGPGSRGSPAAPIGQAPTLNNIPTYADPRRPSSGLISETNPRQFKSNIANDPTYGATNLAYYNGLGITTPGDGFDIFVFGLNHGTARGTYDIDIWDPYLVKQFGGAAATPPYTVTGAAHGKGANALNWAVKAYSRWGDAVGFIGKVGELKLCSATNAGNIPNNEICWQTQLLQAKVIVGVCLIGGVALGAASQATISPSLTIGGRNGSICNFHWYRVYFYGDADVTSSQFFNYVANNGDNVLQTWTFSGLTGLHGAYNCKNETPGTGLSSGNLKQSGFGLQHNLRTFCASNRLDFRDNEMQFGREHIFYLDNTSPPQAGVESGVAAASFFLRNLGIAGLTTGPKNGSTKPTLQLTARNQDHVNNCSVCLGGCGTCNHSDGPNGEGDIYIIDNEMPVEVSAADVPHEYSINGHHGRVILKAKAMTGGVLLHGNAGCCDGLRVVNGNDGEVYSIKEVIIRDLETAAVNMDTPAFIKAGSVMRLEIQSFTVPAGFTPKILAIATGSYSNAKYNGKSISNCGYVVLPIANPLSGWAGWPGGAYTTGKIRFGYSDGGSTSLNDSSTTPPLIGHQHTPAEADAFYFGVCRNDIPAPPVGGSTSCANNPA